MVENNFDFTLERTPLTDDQLKLVEYKTTVMEHFRLAVGVGGDPSVKEILARTDEEVALLRRAELIDCSVEEMKQMSEEELMIAEDKASARLVELKQKVKMVLEYDGKI